MDHIFNASKKKTMYIFNFSDPKNWKFEDINWARMKQTLNYNPT